MFIQSLFNFKLKSRNLGLADITETVNHIWCMSKFRRSICGRFIILRIKIHQISRIVNRHIIPNIIVEYGYFTIGIFIFPFQRKIEIHGFLWFKVRISNPIPTQSGFTATDCGICNIRAIHFPVIIQLAHTGFRIAGTHISL